mmetsp:Transcript_4654/g.15395  ORF Transcript_4654/g.15395 Transcript_4654/m.15395 type:complete len:288 (+) Transcript_4654:2961-3824(+)
MELPAAEAEEIRRADPLPYPVGGRGAGGRGGGGGQPGGGEHDGRGDFRGYHHGACRDRLPHRGGRARGGEDPHALQPVQRKLALRAESRGAGRGLSGSPRSRRAAGGLARRARGRAPGAQLQGGQGLLPPAAALPVPVHRRLPHAVLRRRRRGPPGPGRPAAAHVGHRRSRHLPHNVRLRRALPWPREECAMAAPEPHKAQPRARGGPHPARADNQLQQAPGVHTGHHASAAAHRVRLRNGSARGRAHGHAPGAAQHGAPSRGVQLRAQGRPRGGRGELGGGGGGPR